MEDLINRIVHNVKASLLKEDFNTEPSFDKEIDYFAEYVNDYTDNMDFNPNEISRDELIDFCHNSGDFFIIINSVFKGGLSLHVASTKEQRMAVINDITNGEFLLTHEVDYLIENKLNFNTDYIAVFKIQPNDDDIFYLVYEQSKNDTYNRYNESKKQKKIVKLSRKDLSNLIQESVQNFLINEVRYIPSYMDFKDTKQFKDYENEPIYDNEKIRVFHGCDMPTAVRFAKNGIDGTQKANRRFSYENGMNPQGLFVTTSFKTATNFFGDGNIREGHVVLEFTVNSNDLDTPVWNGQDSFFVQGSNPMPFRNKEERDRQKQNYDIKAKEREEPHISYSDNPAMAEKIFANSEHQALFFGQIDPNQIKRFWVKQGDCSYNAKWQKMNLSQFLKKYGEVRFFDSTDYQGNDKYVKVYKEKAFRPNEKFTSMQDMMARIMYNISSQLFNERKKNGTLRQHIESYINQFNNHTVLDDERLRAFIKRNLYPKQAIALLGKEKYDEVMGEVWR